MSTLASVVLADSHCGSNQSADAMHQPNTMSLEAKDEILNKKEAAKVLRISVRTADEWMKKGILPFIKMPTGAVRFRRSHLLGLMDRYAVSTGGVV
jgi:excisionase family DNA binding protein